ncbi:hypothetical protein CO611_02890 [Lysobacteraceae bacterium NML03-0222]|nr:hypothetical protein CO611_02890 [Xanthomonadaceae bacterium NML03-0222]
MSEARLRALRGDNAQPDEPPPTDPNDPPPEWAYHIGKASRSMAAAERFGQKVMQLPPAWRKAVLDDAQGRIVEWFKPTWTGRVQRAWDEIEAASAEQMLTGRKPKVNVTRVIGHASPIGFLTQRTLDALDKPVRATRMELPAMVPDSALISMTDHQIYHALREAKGDRDVIRRALESLPDWIRMDDTQLYREQDTLHFARPLPDGRYVVAVLRWNEVPNKGKEKVTGNWVITLKVVKGFSGIRVR